MRKSYKQNQNVGRIQKNMTRMEHVFSMSLIQTLSTAVLMSTMYTAPPFSACQAYHMCSKQRQGFHVGNLGILVSYTADLYIKTVDCHCVPFAFACAWLYAKKKIEIGNVQQKTVLANFANGKIVHVVLNMHSNAAGAKQCKYSYGPHLV